MEIRYKLLIFIFISHILYPFSQKQARKEIWKGNKNYRQEKYLESETYYRKALENDIFSMDAIYNLGNALYKQRREEEALRQYQIIIKEEKKPKSLSMAWHNIGNVYMKFKEYQKSIEAYKNSLRKNSQDEETRYNLSLAQRLLQQQRNQSNCSQASNQNQFSQNKKNQHKLDQKLNQERKNRRCSTCCKMTKEDVEQILNAFIQNEKNTQEKIYRIQVKSTKRKVIDKNW